MTTIRLPVRVAVDGTVTFPDKLPFDPYKLPWVTGAEDTLPGATRKKYPEGREKLNDALKNLRSKRAQNGAAPRQPAFKVGGTLPDVDDSGNVRHALRP